MPAASDRPERINKDTVVTAIAQRLGDDSYKNQQHIKLIVDLFINQIETAMYHQTAVSIQGFGKFYARHRAARVARNPTTNEPVKVPATTRIGFAPGTRLNGVVARREHPAPVTAKEKVAARKRRDSRARQRAKAAATATGASTETPKKTAAKKVAGTKTAAKKTPAKASPAKKTATVTKKAPAKKAAAKKTATKRTTKKTS